MTAPKRPTATSRNSYEFQARFPRGNRDARTLSTEPARSA